MSTLNKDLGDCTEPYTEEIIFTGFDEGWQCDLDVRLISYKDGSMDLHRQTGLQHVEHVAIAKTMLQARGLDVDLDHTVHAGITGVYYPVTKLEAPVSAPAGEGAA